MTKPIAIFCGDIHLTNVKPIARCDEPDWEQAQFRVLSWLQKLRIPCVIGGDLLDKPVLPIGFLNKIPQYMPDECMCTVGNHEQFDKRSNNTLDDSAWTTLMLMNSFEPYSYPDVTAFYNNLVIGFIPNTNSEEEFLSAVQVVQSADIVVMHKYVWCEDSGKYPGALESSRADNISKLFPNAKWIFCSDNHRAFQWGNVINCGMLIRDNADLVDYKPRVYVLFDDMSILPLYAPIDEDLITDRHIVKAKENKVHEDVFIRTIGESKDISLSFNDNLKNVLSRLDKQECVEYIMGKYTSIMKGDTI